MRCLLGVVGGGGEKIGIVGVLKLGLEGLEGCSLLMLVVLVMLWLKCGVVIHSEV